MRVLLDEQLSRRLRFLLADHEVSTVAYQGWRGTQNGALLALAESHGFELLLTADRNVPYQQSLRGRRIAVVVLSISDFDLHRERAPSIALAISDCAPGSLTLVELS